MIRPLLHRGGVRPDGALSLGAHWFDRVEMNGALHPASGLCDEQRAALTTPRADICGLPMDRPQVMGILNVTPDSFSDGGDYAALNDAVARAFAMGDDVDMLDIGGESTRPGAGEVPITEEIRRTAPVIAALREQGFTKPISIDTRKAAVADAALQAGANLVNDVSAFTFDPEIADVAAHHGAAVCLMHAQGLPDTMQDNPTYSDVLGEVYNHLSDRIDFAINCGIARDRIIADPGIGFGKTLEHNLTLLNHLAAFHGLGVPILLGVSRKRFIGAIAGVETAKDRMAGSVAVALHGLDQGVQMLRVHDVAETAQAVRLWRAMAQ